MAEEAYAAQEKRLGDEGMRTLERHMTLEAIDTAWKDHLYAMDHLKEGVGLRAYGQLDPLVEYKRDGYEMFSRMMDGIKESVIPMLLRMEAVHLDEEDVPEEDTRLKQYKESRPELNLGLSPAAGMAADDAALPLGTAAPAGQIKVEPIKRQFPKVGRNDPCPCGSGKKYKQCHGK